MDEKVNALLPLAAKIAREFGNIPGLPFAMSGLSPRLRVVAEGIRDGKSYSEIGSSLGISKQAAHKLAGAAITALREKLESMGFAGVDTLGLLKSGCGVPPQAVQEASRLPSSPPRLTISRLNRNTPTELPMHSVNLHVRSSDGTSKSFTLSEHDTFLLGRMDDCHLCVPGDPQVSRHHFLLEVCPPKAALRDLGSMNGTHLNFPKPVSDVWSFAAFPIARP